jgi:hypothetical protein
MKFVIATDTLDGDIILALGLGYTKNYFLGLQIYLILWEFRVGFDLD